MQHVDANNHRLTVLLANEQEGWHQTVRQLLEPQGVQTVCARSGREALSLLESRPIHVAVLDAHMPQLGGLQVMKLMREIQQRRGSNVINVPPAILLANQLTTHLLHEALGMHVFSVLSKPVDFNVLLDTLARVLRRHYENRWPKESDGARAADVQALGGSDGHGNVPGNVNANVNGSAGVNGSAVQRVVTKTHRVIVNGSNGTGNGSSHGGSGSASGDHDRAHDAAAGAR